MDISDEALEHSLDYLMDEEDDFLDIETEEMLLEENVNTTKNKILKNQNLKNNKNEGSSQSKQNCIAKSQTKNVQLVQQNKNIKEKTKQENSNIKSEFAKQSVVKSYLIRKRNGNRKWYQRNKYRRYVNNFEQERNITYNYQHNNRNVFDNFPSNNMFNSSSLYNICRLNNEMSFENPNNRYNLLSNFDNNYQTKFMNDQQSLHNYQIKFMNDQQPLNNYQTKFMNDQQSVIESNQLINLIRNNSLLDTFEDRNRLNIYKMELITLMASKLFDLLHLIHTTV